MHIPAIERIEVTPFQIPLATFLRSGRQMHVKKAENVLVRVTADDGTVGIAEANAFAELFGESQVSIVHAISDWIAPREATQLDQSRHFATPQTSDCRGMLTLTPSSALTLTPSAAAYVMRRWVRSVSTPPPDSVTATVV